MTSDESNQHRYLFTVRQQFDKTPAIDCFYKLKVPAGITGDHAAVMTKLNKNWCKTEIAEDTQSLSGMQLRLRFNSDCYPKVCLVRTTCEITSEELDNIITMKNIEGKLIEFLDESAIK